MAFRDLFRRRKTKEEVKEAEVPELKQEVQKVDNSVEEEKEVKIKAKTETKKKQEGARIILQSKSPSCNEIAIVEETDECVYFELVGNTYSGPFMKSCWVRNYKPGPDEMQPRIKENGESTMLAKRFCAEPEGSPKIYSANLEVVWFEEGDGAALLYNGEILSIIANDVNERCPGYSRDCIAPTTFAWPLGDEKVNPLITRVKKAQEYWETWDDEKWSGTADEYLRSIDENIGKINNMYSIDGGKWPPKVMATVEKDDITYLFTAGVSLRPQPRVQAYVSNPRDFRRFELAFAIKTELLEKNKKDILQYICNVACLPWINIGWIANGHTVRCNVFNDGETKFNNVMFLSNMFVDNAPNIHFNGYRGDRVNILWIVPITDEEELFCEKNRGSKDLFETRKESDDSVIVFTGKSKFNPEIKEESSDEVAASKEE